MIPHISDQLGTENIVTLIYRHNKSSGFTIICINIDIILDLSATMQQF